MEHTFYSTDLGKWSTNMNNEGNIVECLENIDNIVEFLENKIFAYIKISIKLNFFSNLENLTDSEMKNAAAGLQKAYPEYLESYLYEELVQFSYLLNEKCSGINIAERDIWVYQSLKKDCFQMFPLFSNTEIV